MTEQVKPDFCIEIQFKKKSEAPSRIFKTLSELIEAFIQLDKELVQSIDPKLEPVIILEDIESGSLKTWLRYAIKEIDDDAIKKLDWRPAVGKYILKAKYLILNYLENKTEITDIKDVKEVENRLIELAEETKTDSVLVSTQISPKRLFQNISNIFSATTHLLPEDSISYITDYGRAKFNLSFKIDPPIIEDLLTKEKIESINEMILKVKKPDYLGESRWDFKHENRIITARITDYNWLKSFQERKIDVRPQDSIRAKVRISTKYGYDFEVVGINYEIVEVLEIIPFTLIEQESLF